MFRMPPQIDPAEEKKRVREGVRNNFFTFAILCAAIRLGKPALIFSSVPPFSTK